MKVVFDTCVIIDILQKRDPFYKEAVKLLHAVSNRHIEGIITAKSLSDIYYLLRKNLCEEDVRKVIETLNDLFILVDTFASDCELALSSKMTDYEDAIMVETAIRVKADCIVTRNTKDYKESKIKIFSPKELCNEISLN